MFRGLTSLSLDSKGRLAMPTKYRDKITELCGGKLIVTIDTEQTCLLLYPYCEWQIIEEKISSLPSFNPVARRIQRLLIGHATDVELDSNGRFILPTVLREYAGLKKKVMFLGQSNKFEIWSDKAWQQSREEWLADGLKASDDLPIELESLSL